jgi:hypothetical protein
MRRCSAVTHSPPLMRDHVQTDVFTAPDSAIRLAKLVAALPPAARAWSRLSRASFKLTSGYTPSEILLSLPAVVRLQEPWGDGTCYGVRLVTSDDAYVGGAVNKGWACCAGRLLMPRKRISVQSSKYLNAKSEYDAKVAQAWGA